MKQFKLAIHVLVNVFQTECEAPVDYLHGCIMPVGS